MFRVDDRSVVVPVSERVRTRSPVTMCHAWSHKNSVKTVHVSHHVCDFSIVVEAVLGRDRGIRPTSILDHFPAMVLELGKVGIGRVRHQREGLGGGFEFTVKVKEWTSWFAKHCVAPECCRHRILASWGG